MKTGSTVGGVSFPHAPILIGAGVCKSPESSKKWLQIAPVVSGSYTRESRDGNSGERLFFPQTEEGFESSGFGLNSFGMPNTGIEQAISELKGMPREHPLVVSVAGFSIDEYAENTELCACFCNAAAIEVNLGCPNTGHGKIMSFDLSTLERLFLELGSLAFDPKNPRLWVKFSPYSDPGLLKEVAELVALTEAISAVVTCGTFPNAYAGENTISSMRGLAGLSGPAMKPIAMGQVQQFRQHLPDHVDVIGVGGITTGDDVVDFINAGAKAVQLTSMPFWLGDPGKFWERLLSDETGSRLQRLLDQKGAR